MNFDNWNLGFVCFLLFIICYLSPASARAAIGVSPDKLEFNENAPEQTLFLRNLDTKDVRINISLTDEANKDTIKISDPQMSLGPGESRAVKISADTAKNHKNELAIVSQSKTDADLSIAAGVKIPVTVKAANQAGALFLPLILALAVTAGSYLIFQIRNRFQKTDNYTTIVI